LLDKKNLRNFHGVKALGSMILDLTSHDFLFFDARTASFRGAFIGFTESLIFDSKILPSDKAVFYDKRGKLFLSLLHVGRLKKIDRSIFWRGKRRYFTCFLNEKMVEPGKHLFYKEGLNNA